MVNKEINFMNYLNNFLDKKEFIRIDLNIGEILDESGVGAAVLAGTVLATARGTPDNTNQADNTVITNNNFDTANFLTADESFNLVSNDSNVRDQIAAGIYYKDIGSRKGLTVAQSDVEYTGSSDNVKTVYTSKAITDIRRLVTEGYIKIERQTLNVEVATEKASL